MQVYSHFAQVLDGLFSGGTEVYMVSLLDVCGRLQCRHGGLGKVGIGAYRIVGNV